MFTHFFSRDINEILLSLIEIIPWHRFDSSMCQCLSATPSQRAAIFIKCGIFTLRYAITSAVNALAIIILFVCLSITFFYSYMNVVV